MTEPTQQQRIDRLAIEFMGWHRKARRSWWLNASNEPCAYWGWNPFASLDDARRLLEECDRRNLFGKLEDRFYTISVHWRLALKSGLMTTAEQQTEAVWVAAGLGEHHAGE